MAEDAQFFVAHDPNADDPALLLPPDHQKADGDALKEYLDRQGVNVDINALPPHYRELAAAGAAYLKEHPGTEEEQAFLAEAAPPPAPALDLRDFPTGVHPPARERFVNWSGDVDVPNQPVVTPTSREQLVALAQWAASHGYQLRPRGHRHNWSPLVVTQNQAAPPHLLVDTRMLPGAQPSEFLFKSAPVPTVTAGAGATLFDITHFLEKCDNHGAGTAPGFSFPNMPGPGDLSLGGMLAVGAHGTGVPLSQGQPILEGSLSNLVVSLTAVASDEHGQYGLRTFSREHVDTAALLVHLGRAMIVDATLRVVPNYALQVTNWWVSPEKLFAQLGSSPPAAPVDSKTEQPPLAALLNRYGSLEVIWFPLAPSAWVKTWGRVPDKVDRPAGPYPYPWASLNPIIRNLAYFELRRHPGVWTKYFTAFELKTTRQHAPLGATMTRSSRDLFLYVGPNTPPMTALGYAVLAPRAEVQAIVSQFFAMYSARLKATSGFPVNGPVEIRCTSIDTTGDLGVAGASPPLLAASSPVEGRPDLDTVCWIDVLTVPFTAGNNAFFADLEGDMIAAWGASEKVVLRPEWSKGWAYTDKGPWTNEARIDQIRARYGTAFDRARETFAKYDAKSVYSNPFLNRIFRTL